MHTLEWPLTQVLIALHSVAYNADRKRNSRFRALRNKEQAVNRVFLAQAQAHKLSGHAAEAAYCKKILSLLL